MVADPAGAGNPPMSSPTRRLSGAVPIYSGTRVVGYVAGTTFRKAVKGSTHLLQRPRGWAADLSSLRDALAAGATHIEILDTECGATYRASIQTMLDTGLEFDRGFGRQIVLPLADWQRPDLGEGSQLSLFGEVGR